MSFVVTARDVSFELPNGRPLFQNLNLSLGAGITALVGPNGMGKTLLAQLLAGELSPTGGTIRRNGLITLFPQRRAPGPVSVEDFLAPDYVWSPLGESLLEGIDREALCTKLSGGEWMRTRLARALGEGYLILDEPTNDLDREGRAAVRRFLSARPGGCLLISHDRECLVLCEEVLELSNRGIARYGGGWSAYVTERDRERARLAKSLEAAKRDRDRVREERREKIARQEKRNRRGAEAGAKGGMPKILLGARKRRAQATTGKVDVVTLERANESVRALHEKLAEVKSDSVMHADLLGREIPSQKLVVEATGFNIRFNEKWLYRSDLDFSWRGNIRLAVRGGNGSGKSTLLRAIRGEFFETRGKLRPGNLVTLYLDQKCEALDDNKSVYDNVREVASLTEGEIRNGLARFLFMKDSVFQPVGTLSGGERLRASLARGFLSREKPELLILDEPTNNLDLANVAFLEALLSDFPGALIVVSHDEVFLENCGIREALKL